MLVEAAETATGENLRLLHLEKWVWVHGWFCPP